MGSRLRIGNQSIWLPPSKVLRIALGLVLILGGLLGFLPVLGFWMIPLGLLVLSVDLPFVRRWRRNIQVWWGKRGKGERENGARKRS